MTFTKATKKQTRGRLALIGPPGSGKTYTSLLVAQHLGKKVALIDTEHASAAKYGDRYTFDTRVLTNFDPLFPLGMSALGMTAVLIV